MALVSADALKLPGRVFELHRKLCYLNRNIIKQGRGRPTARTSCDTTVAAVMLDLPSTPTAVLEPALGKGWLI
jgi:hypothetical protein